MHYWTRFLNLRRTRPRLFALSAFTLVSLAVFPFVELALQQADVAHGFTFFDFRWAFYEAGERLLEGKPLYGPHQNPYVYPPFVAFVFAPFALLAPAVANIAWDLFSLGVLLLGIFTLLRACDAEPRGAERVAFVYGVLGFFPTILWLKAGQVSGLLTGLLCFAVAFHQRGLIASGDASRMSAVASGVTTTLASSMKPFYAVSGAHLLNNKYRFAGAVGMAAILAVASLALFGIDLHVEYIEVLIHGKDAWEQQSGYPGGLRGAPTDWGPAYFAPLHVLGDLALYVRGVFVAGVATLALASRRVADPRVETSVLCLGLAAIPIASPIPDLYAVNVLVPVILVTLITEFRRSDGVPVVPVLALLFIHVHAYTLGFLAGFGWKYVPALEVLTPVLPVLQPAMWGVFLLLGLHVTRVARPLNKL